MFDFIFLLATTSAAVAPAEVVLATALVAALVIRRGTVCTAALVEVTERESPLALCFFRGIGNVARMEIVMVAVKERNRWRSKEKRGGRQKRWCRVAHHARAEPNRTTSPPPPASTMNSEDRHCEDAALATLVDSIKELSGHTADIPILSSLNVRL